MSPWLWSPSGSADGRLEEAPATVSIDADSFGDFLRELDTLEAMAREADTYDSYWRYRLDNLRGAVAAARDHGPTAKVEIG